MINTDLTESGEVFIRWAIANDSPDAIDYPFYVDLHFDGVFVERWSGSGILANQVLMIADWDGLGARVGPQSGTHKLTLVVDSTGLIPETDESDNEFATEVAWSTAVPSVTATPVPIRLPDLVPGAGKGWDSPIIATSYSGDTVDGPLSVDLPSYFRLGVRNDGLTSTTEDVWVHLYLDDLFVQRWILDGLLADVTRVVSKWAGLYGVTNVSPGPYTLRVVVDPHDLVTESDEGNNTFEKLLTWETGPVPPKPDTVPVPAATAPVPLALPNLVPAWSYGSDGPIVISHEMGTLLDSPLTTDQTPYVDVAVFNRSSVEATAPFSIDLLFDGQKVHTFKASGPARPGFSLRFKDWDGLSEVAQLSEGLHTLRMVIDPDDAVEEADEDDNVFEKTFVWTDGPVAASEPITYSDSQLGLMLADLPSFLDIRQPALNAEGVDHTGKVVEVVDAGYYLMTGKSLQDERLEISLLTRAQYLAWIDEHFEEKFAVKDVSEYPSTLARREEFKNEARGFKTRRFGKVVIVVDAERPVDAVINSLAHEVGHMRQDFLNPAQTESEDFYYLAGIQEAEAQQFERAFWLTLEEYMGLRFLQYPDYENFRRLIDARMDFWEQNAALDEHWLGALLQWLVVLDDPALVELKEELTASGRLGAISALSLYGYLVDLSPDIVVPYVEARLNSLDALSARVRAMAIGRLVPGLRPDDEGTSALRIPGLLMP